MKTFCTFLAIIAFTAVIVIAISEFGKKTDGAAPEKPGQSDAPKTGGKKPAAATAAKPKPKAQPGKSTPARESGRDADDEAIEFHNDLCGMLAAATKPLEKISRDFANAVNDAHRDYESDRMRWRSLRSFSLGDDFGKIPGRELRPPANFAAADREFFTAGITAVRDSVREIIATVGGMEKYYNAEDYKDDWYKTLYMVAPRMEELIATIRRNSEQLTGRVVAITEEIDNRNVTKIPVGKWVLNMRGFMKKHREMTACLLREEFSDPSYGTAVKPDERQARIQAAQTWADKAEALCAELDEMAASQKALVIEGFEGSQYEKTYVKFYERYEASKPVTRRVIRELRERGVVHDSLNVRNEQRDIGRVLGEFSARWNDKGSRGK